MKIMRVSWNALFDTRAAAAFRRGTNKEVLFE